MRERETDRRRRRAEAEQTPAPNAPHPVLALQRSLGNRAVAQVLARSPATTGSVQIHGVGDIKVKGGNLEEWTAAETPNTVDVTSHKGRHSAKLEHLSTSQAKGDVKVTIAPANHVGEQLSVGGGTLLEIKGARVADYAVSGGGETWRLTDFTNVHRTKITHHIA
jgi:hypothetical protein